MTFGRRIKAIFILLIIITTSILVFLWLNSLGLSLNQTVESIAKASPALLLLAIGMAWCEMFLRIVRFRELVGVHAGRVGFRGLASPYLAGFFAGSITPMRAGEPVKAVLISSRKNISLGGTIVATIIERLLDLLLVLSLLLLASYLIWTPQGVANIGLALSFLLIILGTYLFLVVGGHTRLLTRLADSIVRRSRRQFWSKAKGLLDEYQKVMAKRTPGERLQNSLTTLCLSLAVIVIDISMLIVVFYSMGVVIGFLEVSFALCAGTLVGILSQSPGGAVTTEAMMVYLLVDFGLPPEIALSGTVMARIIGYYTFVIIGWFLFTAEGAKELRPISH